MDKADIVIIGSGVGGSAVAHQLAGSGAKILILELGDFLPNEPENSDPNAVFLKSRYKTQDQWTDAEGKQFRPGRITMLEVIRSFTGPQCFAFVKVILMPRK